MLYQNPAAPIHVVPAVRPTVPVFPVHAQRNAAVPLVDASTRLAPILDVPRDGAPPIDKQWRIVRGEVDEAWSGPRCCGFFELCQACKIFHCRPMICGFWAVLGLAFLMLLLAAAIITRQKNGDPTWLETYLIDRWQRNVCCLVFTVLKIIYDCKVQGWVGIRIGIFSGAVVWILLLPLHKVIIDSVATGFFVAICIGFIALTIGCCSIMCMCMESCPARTFTIFVIGVSLYQLGSCINSQTWWFFVDNAMGRLLCDLVVFVLCFIFLQHRILPAIPQDITAWNYDFVEEISPSSKEFKAINDYVQTLAAKQFHHYGHSMHVVKMHRVYPKDRVRYVDSAADEEDVLMEELVDKPFLSHVDPHGINTLRLFHGTDFVAAESILQEGYRLGVSGMFGGGIYFADCPQKSCNHSSKGLLLLNRVELGQPKFVAQSTPSEKGYGYHWLYQTANGAFLRPSDAYDSVVAVTRDMGGAVNVPEYVIYNPRQATVEYILQVERT